LTLPWALGEARFVRNGAYAWGEAARRTRRLHLAFAVLLALGVLAARAIATRVA
jgi:ABC-type branched-subunit amino acid transport system permease subunit